MTRPPRFPAAIPEVKGQGILAENPDLGIFLEKLFPQELGQGRVPFQGHHLPGFPGQKDGEGPQAGADFHHRLLPL